jgi:hypothetical protein
MELTVFERLILLNALPKEGDFITLKIVRKLREDLSFSEEEHKILNFKQDENSLHWNIDGDILKNIEIGTKAMEIICDVLKKLNDSKKLTEQHYSLYEKFVGE